MDYQTRNYLFDDKGNMTGHERVETHVLTLENHHYLPADLEIVQHIKHPHWSIENSPDLAAIYQQVDIDTVKYTLTLPAYSRQEIRYTLLLKEEGSARRAIH
jgi:hypothetical protein